MNCVICETRKPRRQCPGVHGNICSICCGTEREQSIDCPLECRYLREAHEHEHLPEVDDDALPNRDVPVTEDFLRANEVLLAFLAVTIFEGALQNPAANDWDVREALDALVKTYRTLQAGFYYETQPSNTIAARVMAHVQKTLVEIKQKEIEVGRIPTLRDATTLGVLAFLQRLEYSHNNGRKRSRAFLDFLGGFYIPAPESAAVDAAKPNEPQIIL